MTPRPKGIDTMKISRELKFRGKSINGEWHSGLLSISRGLPGQPGKGHYISNRVGMPWAYQVIPETVGRLVSPKDKKGNPIYEDDIVKHHSNKQGDAFGLVYYNEHEFRINWVKGSSRSDLWNKSEIVGNRFDHPALLEKDE